MEENKHISNRGEALDLASTSILKKKACCQNTIPSLVKSVNFSHQPEEKSDQPERQPQNNDSIKPLANNYGYNCDGLHKRHNNQDTLEGSPKDDDNVFVFKSDKSVTKKDLASIALWRRNRSQSLPEKQFMENTGVFVEVYRSFILRNRYNARDTNVTLPTYELRYVIDMPWYVIDMPYYA